VAATSAALSDAFPWIGQCPIWVVEFIGTHNGMWQHGLVPTRLPTHNRRRAHPHSDESDPPTAAAWCWPFHLSMIPSLLFSEETGHTQIASHTMCDKCAHEVRCAYFFQVGPLPLLPR
jgi:hypothetical protein